MQSLGQPDILLDEPAGEALKNDVVGRIVVTRCLGVPYLLDVLEGQPKALVARTNVFQAHEALACLKLAGEELLYLGPTLYHSPLTPCERRVLQFIAFGLTNPQIAKKVGRGVSTVNTQVTRLLEKMSVRSRHHAANVYWGQELPPPQLDN